MQFDVLIVGGGPAGLSAALILGRCHRTVLLCDAGHQRNLRSHAIHGLLGREGRSPAVFLDEARAELARYKSVSVRDTLVESITPAAEGFEFFCTDGTAGRVAKVLLASGLVDELPEVAGIEPLYGISIHHCLYCDGFEYAGKPAAALGKGDKGAELALMMKHWIQDIVVCSDGTNGELTKIIFKSGPDLPRAALFFSTGCHQASDLSKRLGCQRDAKGGVMMNSNTEETSVSGVYVAGDVSRDVLLVAAAIAEGAQAAVAINKAFLRRDGFCD